MSAGTSRVRSHRQLLGSIVMLAGSVARLYLFEVYVTSAA